MLRLHTYIGKAQRFNISENLKLFSFFISACIKFMSVLINIFYFSVIVICPLRCIYFSVPKNK
jgi:hypothetical protein